MPQQWDKQEIKGPVQKKKTPPRTTQVGVLTQKEYYYMKLAGNDLLLS